MLPVSQSPDKDRPARCAKAPDWQAALDMLARERRTETLRISRQVVREHLAVATRPPNRYSAALEIAADH